MTTADEILAAIKKLSAAEREKLNQHLYGVPDDEWDRQMIDDAKRGKFDAWLKEVDAEIDGGQLRELP